MKKNKIYTLVLQSVCSCGVDTHVLTYTTRKAAQAILNDSYAHQKQEIPPLKRKTEKGKNFYRIWEKDNYLQNNLTGTIFVTEPDTDKWDTDDNEF